MGKLLEVHTGNLENRFEAEIVPTTWTFRAVVTLRMKRQGQTMSAGNQWHRSGKLSLPFHAQRMAGHAFTVLSRLQKPLTLAVAALSLTGLLAQTADAQMLWPEEVRASNNRMSRAERLHRGERAERHRARKDRVVEKVAAKPVGPVLIAISIDKQQLKFYDTAGLFAESPVSTGMRGHSTPMGVFSVIGKETFHRSNIYSGAPMPYMQRITWSGVAMHAGVLPGYPASHGCIRLPASFATRMYGWTKRGARVVITPGELSPADFSHPLLIARRPQPETVAVAGSSTIDPAPATLPSIADKPPEKKEGIQTADASGVMPATTASNDTKDQTIKPDTATQAKRTGHISAFVSGKTGKLYVRQDFEPLFDTPVTITGNSPLGTHVFTMRADPANPDALLWSVVSMPTLPRAEAKSSKRKKDQDTVTVPAPQPPSTAAEALNRVTIPDDAKQKIYAALAPGDSLVISDQGLGDETGEGTDFIVLLH